MSPDAAARRRSAIAYALLVLVPIAGVLAVIEVGGSLPPPTSPGEAGLAMTTAAPAALRLPLFLAQIIVIITAARLVGAALRRLGQPQVVGEIVAGLMLGPSLLGAVAPDVYAWLFPAGTVRFLNALSQIGLVLFMFLVGLELNLREVMKRSRQAIVTSHAGIAVPMFGGCALALWLYRDFSTAGTEFVVFALFLGCAMSVTALPVLARILAERQLGQTPFGAMAISSAAVADVTAWGILAVVVALARDAGGATVAMWRTLAGLTVYVVVMWGLVRPALEKIWSRRASPSKAGQRESGGGVGPDEVAGVVFVVLASALATEWLQVHALFGAFVAGVIMPRDSRLEDALRLRFDDLLSVLFLPLFFAYAGLQASVGFLDTWSDWLICGVIILVAVAGKIGGCALAARASGMSWRLSAALGSAMNARGLVELVLLSIGLQIGVITPTLFTMMVIMAIVTTVMTTPLLARILPRAAAAMGVLVALCLVPACAKTMPDHDNRIFSATPAAKLSATDLLQEYETSARDTDRKYGGRAIEISGLIRALPSDPVGSPALVFGGPKVLHVEAFLHEDHAAAVLASIKEGQRVTLKCFVEGVAEHVILKSCIAAAR